MSYVKAVVAAFNQEKALVGAFSVITNIRMELFEALTLILPYVPQPAVLRVPGRRDRDGRGLRAGEGVQPQHQAVRHPRQCGR